VARLTPRPFAVRLQDGSGVVVRRVAGVKALESSPTCLSCAARPAADEPARAAGRAPIWFHLAGALFFGMAYYGFVERLWPGGPLAAANHNFDNDALHHLALLSAPVWIPAAYLGVMALLAWLIFRPRIRVATCEVCRKAERRARWIVRALAPLLVGVAGAALHPIAEISLPAIAVGVVLLPFALARPAVAKLLPDLEGVRVLWQDGRVIALAGPPGLAAILAERAPTALVTEEVKRSPFHLLGFLAPAAVLAFVLGVVPDSVAYRPCPYGSIPMMWRESRTYHYGCMAPTGDRHGVWRGHNHLRQRYEARYRFDKPVGKGTVWTKKWGNTTVSTFSGAGLPYDDRPESR
jgi:hypothetical protein